MMRARSARRNAGMRSNVRQTWLRNCVRVSGARANLVYSDAQIRTSTM
jgi:hypothetical protein